jgi:SAM-dependent methyltransferase
VTVDAAGWDERYGATPLVWSAEPNRFVAELCAPLTPGLALDVAAGEGRNAIWLAARGWDVTAVDFSLVAIAKAEERARAEGVILRTVVADVTAADWNPEPADLVLLAYLQLAGPLMTAVLRRAAAAVAPGGTLLLVAHDRRNLTEGHGGPSDPSVLTTPDQVAAALVDLSVTRAETVERPVDAPRPALDTLVLARRLSTGHP